MASHSIQHIELLSKADLSIEDPHASSSPTTQKLGKWNLSMGLTYSSPEAAARAKFIMEHPSKGYDWKEDLVSAQYTLSPTPRGTESTVPASKIKCSSNDAESRVTGSGRKFLLFKAKDTQWDELGLSEYGSLSFFARQIVQRTLISRRVIIDFNGKVVAEPAGTALDPDAATKF